MRHKTLLLCLLLCAILCAPAFCAEKEKPPEATVKGPGFHFTVALTRATYLEGEPVLAKCSITNDLKTSQKLVEPDDWRVVEWSVLRLPGRERAYHPDWYPLPGTAGLDADCFWEFRPGETKSAYFDVRRNIDHAWTQPGGYAVTFKYAVTNYVKADWVGTLQTSEMSFHVVSATGRDADVVRALRPRNMPEQSTLPPVSLPQLSHEQRVARVAELTKLYNSDRRGRYASLIGYLAAIGLKSIDRPADLDALRKYAIENRNTPYFGHEAALRLGLGSIDAKDYEGAREAFRMFPEGYKRNYYLQSCDRWEERDRQNNK